MLIKRIAVGGSAANPPHLGHRALVQALIESGKFDLIIWIISGQRKDKPILIAPGYRATMTYLTFPPDWFWKGRTLLELNCDDLYNESRPTIRWLDYLERVNPKAEISWFTGVDVFIPQPQFNGKSEIEASWVEGETLLREKPFLVVPRGGYPHPREVKLPPKSEILNVTLPEISSTQIREDIAAGRNFEHLVIPAVAGYIKRLELYGFVSKPRTLV